MIKVRIEPLTEENKLAALDIAVKARVGPHLRVIRWFNKVLRSNTSNMYVAIINSEVVGLIGWYQDKGNWAGKSLGKLFPYGNDIYWVSYFAVTDKLRKKGIGTQLIKKLLSELTKKKAKELWVYSCRATKFYEKIGFKFVTKALIENKLHDFLKYSFI